jgi:hypothetical protein
MAVLEAAMRQVSRGSLLQLTGKPQGQTELSSPRFSAGGWRNGGSVFEVEGVSSVY